MYCLDTNIAIAIFRGDASLKERITKVIEKEMEIFITPITLCELYKGAFLANRFAEAIALINNLLKSVKVLDFTESACFEFGKLYADLKKSGKPTQQSDLMIASITKVNELIFITRNTKDFENIRGLKIEEW